MVHKREFVSVYILWSEKWSSATKDIKKEEEFGRMEHHGFWDKTSYIFMFKRIKPNIMRKIVNKQNKVLVSI